MASLVINPIGGIANRLRAIVSGISLADELRVPVKIVWAVNSDLAAPIDDLLNLTVFKGKYNNIVSNITACKQLFEFDLPRKKNFYLSFLPQMVRYGMMFSDGSRLNPTSDLDLTSLKRALNRNRDILIQSGLEFFEFSDDLYRRMIQPLEHFETEALEVLDGCFDVVGFHIRRTDNEMSIKHSPLEIFFSAIEQEIDQNQNMRFYIASDDQRTKLTFIKRYGTQRVIVSQTKPERNTRAGIHNGFLELIILSKCLKIYGSYYSSFSEAAARIGDIRLITLKKGV